jgi:hypothetical protein
MRHLLIIMLLLISSAAIAQREAENPRNRDRVALSLGILNGGGSIFGGDLEVLIGNNLGLSAGAGWRGYGAGINLHFKPTVRSSFITFEYLHQGIGETHAQTIIGSSFVLRSKGGFACKLGFGHVIEEGRRSPYEGKKMPKFILLYALGGYIPLG